jgi:hypothetical protein
VTMKNFVFYDVASCGSCKNRCFRGIYRSIIRVTRIIEVGKTLPLTSSPNLVTLMMEAIRVYSRCVGR